MVTLKVNTGYMNAFDYFTIAINGFIVLLLILKPGKCRSDGFLLAFTFVLLLGNVLEMLVRQTILSLAIISTLIFLWGPFVYLHVQCIIGAKRYLTLHFILPTVSAIFIILFSIEDALTNIIPVFITLLIAFIFISLVYYSVLIILILQRTSWYRSQVSENELRWIRVLVICFVSFVIFSFISLFLADFTEQLRWTGLVESAISAIIITAFGWQGYLLGIFYPRNVSRTKLSHVDLEKREVLFRQLEELMREEKPFLNPTLGVDDLSEYLGVNKKYVSNAVNYAFGESVPSYINHHRLSLFKEKIVDQKQYHLTIEAIALSCGFNSKSSFNRIFKAKEGITPSEFRNLQID